MIKLLKPNDVLEASNLMSDTWNMDEYSGYERNEALWIQGLINIIHKQITDNPNVIAIKHVDNNNKILGFMLGEIYNESYSGKPVMDVKDMIVDYKAGRFTNAKTVKSCFDYMIDHTKKHGGKDWRADSIHSERHAKAYAEFLNKQYNCTIRYGARGVINE